MFLGDSLVSWKSKKHPTVCCSFAEYKALAAVASEISWLQDLLKNFELHLDSSMVFCDSQSTIHLSTNPTFHERSKHVEIDCHFIRERVASGAIKLIHVKS